MITQSSRRARHFGAQRLQRAPIAANLYRNWPLFVASKSAGYVKEIEYVLVMLGPPGKEQLELSRFGRFGARSGLYESLLAKLADPANIGKRMGAVGTCLRLALGRTSRRAHCDASEKP